MSQNEKKQQKERSIDPPYGGTSEDWENYLKQSSRMTFLTHLVSITVTIIVTVVFSLLWALAYFSIIMLFAIPIFAIWIFATHSLWRFQKVQLPLGLDNLQSAENQEDKELQGE